MNASPAFLVGLTWHSLAFGRGHAFSFVLSCYAFPPFSLPINPDVICAGFASELTVGVHCAHWVAFHHGRVPPVEDRVQLVFGGRGVTVIEWGCEASGHGVFWHVGGQFRAIRRGSRRVIDLRTEPGAINVCIPETVICSGPRSLCFLICFELVMDILNCPRPR